MGSSTEIALRTTALGKRFGRHWALAHVDLEVAPGEVVLLAGPNGSGKTTLLRLVAGLHRPDQGELEIFGLDPRRARLGSRRLLSMVGHQNYLYPPLTALEMVRTWARLLGRPTGDDELVEHLAEVGLGARAGSRVGGFSAGMRKRLTLVRARLERPRLVLLDEPLAALDAAGGELVERWIGGFRDTGTAVVMASHAVARMCRVADRAVYLEEGQIAWQGASRHLPSRFGGAG